MSSLSISPVCSLCSSDCWKYNVKIGKLRCKWATKLCRVYKRVASQNVWLRELVVQNFNVLPKHESLASTPTIISYNARCYTRIESFQTTIPSHFKKQYNLRWEKKEHAISSLPVWIIQREEINTHRRGIPRDANALSINLWPVHSFKSSFLLIGIPAVSRNGPW